MGHYDSNEALALQLGEIIKSLKIGLESSLTSNVRQHFGGIARILDRERAAVDLMATAIVQPYTQGDGGSTTPILVYLLHENVEVWNHVSRAIRDAGYIPCLYAADLDALDLIDADFRGCDLKHASFVNAVLDGANFTGAHLEEATFRYADLGEVTFDHCYFHMTDFYDTDTSACSFIGADKSRMLVRRR